MKKRVRERGKQRLRHKVVHLINGKSFAKVPLLLCRVAVAVAVAIPLTPGQLLKKVESRFAFG